MKIDLPNDREMEIPLMTPVWIVVAIVVLLGLFTTFYQINAEEQGVVLRLGRYVETADPGLHTKLPFGIDRVFIVPTGISSTEEFGYRSGSKGDFTGENLMLTGDLNIVRAGWSVRYTRVDPIDYLFHVDDPEDTLRDISQSMMREAMGDRASIPVLTVGRAELQHKVRGMIQEYCDQFKMGVRIDVVNLQFVSPPAEVVPAFDDLNKSEHDAARFFEEAAQEYQAKVPMARGKAGRVILEAEGFALRRVNVAQGEAKRFNEIYAAYTHAPEVTRNRMYLESLEKFLPKVQTITVIDEDVEGLLPHLNIQEGGAK